MKAQLVSNMRQNSPEWLSFRRNKIGASDAPDIMNKSSFEGTPYKKWREKIFGEDKVQTPQMRAGKEFEDLALDWFVDKTSPGVRLIPMVGMNKESPWQIASLDGFNETMDCHVEVKTMGSLELFDRIVDGNIPEDYLIQMQHQMGVFGYQYCFLVSCWRGTSEDKPRF